MHLGGKMTYSEAIIKRLTEICQERQITINKLATLSGITQSTMRDLMIGNSNLILWQSYGVFLILDFFDFFNDRLFENLQQKLK